MTRRTTPLTADETVAAARDLLARDGVDRFSMRRLAAVLDVNPMTIYLRFENKDALLAAVGEQVLSEIELPVADDGDWTDRVVALATSIRSRLLADGTAALVLRAVGESLPAVVLKLTDRGLGLMEEAGYTGEQAVEAYRVVFWHAVASALADSAMRAVTTQVTDEALEAVPEAEVSRYRALRPHFGPLDPDALFALSARRLAEGLAAAADE